MEAGMDGGVGLELWYAELNTESGFAKSGFWFGSGKEKKVKKQRPAPKPFLLSSFLDSALMEDSIPIV